MRLVHHDSSRGRKSPVVNGNRAAKAPGGELGCFDEIAEEFVQAVPRLLDQIDEATISRDAKALEGAAQSIRDSIGSLCFGLGHQAVAAFREIEEARRPERVRDALEKLRRKLKALEKALKGNNTGGRKELPPSMFCNLT